MATVRVNGVDLWYKFSGTGETVVQIGGAVSGHEGYATITPGVSEHYRVLDYDHRGYGLSSRPKQRYTLETWSADLAALMDALEIERAHIHGGSMGSFIALDFAARYPEKTDKLLMGAGAVAKCDAMGIHMFRVWQDIASAYGAVSEQLARELLTKAFGRGLLDEMGDDILRETLAVLERNTDTDVFIDACQAMIDTDVRDVVPNVTAPALVMCGRHDILTPLDAGPGGAGARWVAENLPNGRLEIFEHSGHGHYVEEIERSVEVILDFLAS
ncbi:MAG: alpha/beta hydrolase [bacterium]|nr:alpha/beta hydrolase [bacterium]MDE0353289.1 alpha/beta hydrolase [bacterium]